MRISWICTNDLASTAGLPMTLSAPVSEITVTFFKCGDAQRNPLGCFLTYETDGSRKMYSDSVW
jgi:hypothetical protein